MPSYLISRMYFPWEGPGEARVEFLPFSTVSAPDAPTALLLARLRYPTWLSGLLCVEPVGAPSRVH